MFDALRRILSLLRGAEPANGGSAPPADGRGAGADGGGSDGITCEQALALLFDYLDGELDPEEESRVAEHLEVCRRCYPRLQFERSFMEALRRVQRGDGAPPELRERVLGALRDEGLDSR